MSKENPENVGIVCSDCMAERKAITQKKLEGLAPTLLVGKHVKLPFITGLLSPSIEHMWVVVSSVKEGKLTGILDNDPFDANEFKCGDEVVRGIEEVEEVL